MDATRSLVDIPEMSHFIGGRFREDASMEAITVWNPSTGEPLTRMPEASQDAVDAAVGAVSTAQSIWWRLAPGEREATLRRIAQLLEENQERLAQIEVANTGKPVAVARAEVQAAAETFQFAAGFPSKQTGKSIPLADPYQLCYTVSEPVGVVGAVTPWNYPLAIAALKTASALAAGCGVVLKPAPETPLTALELARVIHEADIPEGLFNVVTGGSEAGAAVVGHPGIAKASFTGSTATGSSILHSLADNLRPGILELGGKSPNIVFDDVDLEPAMEPILMAALANTGQECSAGARILVHRDVHDEFLEVARERLLGFSVGPPEEKADLGPLISLRQQDKVGGFVERALDAGATLHTTSKAPGKGFFYAPTLLTDVRNSMEVWREEVFGPVIAVDTFTSESEAVQKANDTRYGLAAGVWTNDIGRATRLARNLQAGKVMVNSYLAGGANAPFGGVKDSGFGRESGVEGILEYTRLKTVIFQGAPQLDHDESQGG